MGKPLDSTQRDHAFRAREKRHHTLASLQCCKCGAKPCGHTRRVCEAPRGCRQISCTAVAPAHSAADRKERLFALPADPPLQVRFPGFVCHPWTPPCRPLSEAVGPGRPSPTTSQSSRHGLSGGRARPLFAEERKPAHPRPNTQGNRSRVRASRWSRHPNARLQRDEARAPEPAERDVGGVFWDLFYVAHCTC